MPLRCDCHCRVCHTAEERALHSSPTHCRYGIFAHAHPHHNVNESSSASPALDTISFFCWIWGSMAIRLCSQAALYSPQISESVRWHAHLRQTLEFSKPKIAVDGRGLNNISYGSGELAGHLIANIGFKSISTKGSRTVVSASMPSLVPAAVQAASRLFTFGTAFVVPFYTVMILAPHATWTKKLVESSVPYVVLGALYVYLLVLSWSPETLQLMFASKYWLPELSGITRMFSNTLTVASAWLHLLAVDLFAGRQIYLDGLQHAIETRHSLILCLLFCPVGMFTHFITKAMVQLCRKANSEELPNVAKLYS